MLAFQHAYSLGQSENNYNIKEAFDVWIETYQKTLPIPQPYDVAYAIMTLTNIEQHDFFHGRRTTALAHARDLCSWFCYVYSDMSLMGIAQFMKYPSHASVIHGFNNINNAIDLYKDDRNEADQLKAMMVSRGFRLKMQDRMDFRFKQDWEKPSNRSNKELIIVE